MTVSMHYEHHRCIYTLLPQGICVRRSRFLLATQPALQMLPVFTVPATYGSYPVGPHGCIFLLPFGTFDINLTMLHKRWLSVQGVLLLRYRSATLHLADVLSCLAIIHFIMIKWRDVTLQSSLVDELAAQVQENNALIEQLAYSFPDTHAGTTVSVFDFASAFQQVWRIAWDVLCRTWPYSQINKQWLCALPAVHGKSYGIQSPGSNGHLGLISF